VWRAFDPERELREEAPPAPGFRSHELPVVFGDEPLSSC